MKNGNSDKRMQNTGKPCLADKTGANPIFEEGVEVSIWRILSGL